MLVCFVKGQTSALSRVSYRPAIRGGEAVLALWGRSVLAIRIE